MATLGTITALTFVSSGGSSAVKKTQTPPINASSPDEEKFIKYVGWWMLAMRGAVKPLLPRSLANMTKGFLEECWWRRREDGSACIQIRCRTIKQWCGKAWNREVSYAADHPPICKYMKTLHNGRVDGVRFPWQAPCEWLDSQHEALGSFRNLPSAFHLLRTPCWCIW